MSETTEESVDESTAARGSVDVGLLHVGHPAIRAQDWRTPLIARLLQSLKYSDATSQVENSFRNPELTEHASSLEVHWTGLKHDFDQCVNTYQANTLTEFATLGLACILLSRNTDYQITEVTRRGERVDYWIGDKAVRKRFVLEVGGLQTGNIDALADEKTAQLIDNPWGRAGFVCVAIYDKASARLWFCPGGSRS